MAVHERLVWLMGAREWVVPADVSQDYQSHMEAVEITTRQHPHTGERVRELRFLKSRYDLRVCEAYIAMEMEMAGLIGAEVAGEEPAGPAKENGQ